MPGVYRYTIDKLGIIVEKAIKNRIPMVALCSLIQRMTIEKSSWN